jgi:uncharacterized glyoxalase superfamily protein PhnB
MTASSQLPAPTLLPLMRYRDLMAAIKWLEEAFGFEKQVAVSDADGNVIYAQMTYGTGMIMLGAVRDTDLDKLMRQPDEVGGVETQSCYVVVEAADAHYARAKNLGAEIVLEIKSDGFGRRGYSCRDPQGHIWNFGTYNPVKGLLGPQPKAVDLDTGDKSRRRFGALAAAMALAIIGGWWWTDGYGTGPSTGVSASATRDEQNLVLLREELAKIKGEKRGAEQAAEMARRALEAERKDRATTEAALRDEKAARAAAEAEVANSRGALAGEQRAKDEALKLLKDAKQRSSSLQSVPEAEVLASREETSALPDPQPSKSDQAASKRPPMRLSSKQRRNAFMPTAPAGKSPTYMVDLADVPWPYNSWYRKRK